MHGLREAANEEGLMKKLRADPIRHQLKVQGTQARVGRQHLKLVPTKPEPGEIWTLLAGLVVGGTILGALGFVAALLKAGGVW